MNNNPLVLMNDLEEKVSEFIEYLIENGGPELHDYEKLPVLLCLCWLLLVFQHHAGVLQIEQ